MLYSKNSQEVLAGGPRVQEIIDFVASHQGCNKKSVVDGVKNSSRVTALKILGELARSGIIDEEREKPNSRECRLFIKEDNPVARTFELMSIQKKYYGLLLDKLQEKYKEGLPGEWPKDTLEIIGHRVNDTDSDQPKAYLAIQQIPLLVLSMIIDSYAEFTNYLLPKRISSKSSLEKLNGYIYSNCYDMQALVSKYKESIGKDNEGEEWDHVALSFRHTQTPLQRLVTCYSICARSGLGEEIEKILDVMRPLFGSISVLFFPEIRIYDWDFNPEKDSWRKLFDYMKQII